MSFANPYWVGSLVKNSLSAVENGFASKRKASSMAQDALARLCWHLNSHYMHTFLSSFPTCKVQIIPCPGSHTSKVMIWSKHWENTLDTFILLYLELKGRLSRKGFGTISLAADGYVRAPEAVLELGEWWWEEGFFYKAMGGKNLSQYWANSWRSFTKCNMAQEKILLSFIQTQTW